MDHIMTTTHRPPPPHIKRRMAYLRSAGYAAGVAFDVWIEQQWYQFMRIDGRRRRSGTVQMEFDNFLDGLK